MPEVPQGQIAPGTSPPAPDATVRAVPARSATVVLGRGWRVVEHRVDFDGLQPATHYMYRVGGSNRWSPWHEFVTASEGREPFSFIYFGDAQTGLRDVWPSTVNAARLAAPGARFAVHAGDLVDDGYDDRLWGDWVAGLSALAPVVPNIPVPGNHDEPRGLSALNVGRALLVSPLWKFHFALPANGPSSLPELAGQNYYVDYQGVRIIALDVSAFAGDDILPTRRSRVRPAEIAWLADVLASNPNPWTVVVQHHPIFAISKGRDYSSLRRAIQPLYDRFRVDLVLQGHDHAYGRSHKVNGDHLAVTGEGGTIYAIAVAGSKMYELAGPRQPLMAVTAAGLSTFQVISIAGGSLSYESRRIDGTLVDAFRLTKKGSGPSTYEDLAPGRR